MQRAWLLNLWDAASAPSRRLPLGRLALPALGAGLALAAAAVLAALPQAPIWDQARLLEARFQAPYHPAPPFGFTAQLLVIGLRALLPAGVPLAPALRVVAMLFWGGSAAWLASRVLRSRALVALLLLLLFLSQYPFLWLSSELVAGGFLFAALAAWAGGAPAWLLGALLALLALCKVECLLVAVVLAACFAASEPARGPRVRLGASFAGSLGLLLLPGFALFGAGYWSSYGSGGESRAFATFGQHFAALVAPLQLVPGPDPWSRPGPYVEHAFPGARSLSDVLAAPGLPYLDFVALSAARGARKLGWLFGWAWLALPPLWWARRRGGLAPDALERALLLSFVGCAPFVLFSYPHVRYFARYYPIFWLLLLRSAERVSELPDRALRRRALAAAGVFVALALVQSADRAAFGLAHAAALPQYWFPD
jgi:hypothetical protein